MNKTQIEYIKERVNQIYKAAQTRLADTVLPVDKPLGFDNDKELNEAVARHEFELTRPFKMDAVIYNIEKYIVPIGFNEEMEQYKAYKKAFDNLRSQRLSQLKFKLDAIMDQLIFSDSKEVLNMLNELREEAESPITAEDLKAIAETAKGDLKANKKKSK